MCGIAGKVYFNRDKKVSEALLRGMHETIQHRGPDDHGVYVNPRGHVGLANRRLAIIDLSPLGHMPMSNEDGTVWITFNGEIYNFQELRPDLEKKGHTFRSHSDTEVIVHLWEEYGVDCVKHLRGMFAIAIWDEKKQQLFLARDRLGKKPLKYYMNDHMIVFGSELKSFIDDPEVPKEVDFEAIDAYLTFQYVPHPKTGFKGIKKLPQAHHLLIDLSGDKPITTLTRYWDLDYTKTLDLSEAEWQVRILEAFNEAVKIRMISDVPLGAFLSGGVDSSAVVAFMAENSTQPVKTFSIGFEEEKFNELPHARKVVERYQTDHREFMMEPASIEALPHLVYHYEEPYADSSALPSFYLSKMTRQHVTVALNGDGGDENFAGYPWYGILKREALYRKLPNPLLRLNAAIISACYKLFPNKLFRYGELMTHASIHRPSVLHTDLFAYFSDREKQALYNEVFQKTSQQWCPGDFLEQYYQASGVTNPISRALYTDINTYLANDLNVKIDIATSAYSLESRSPFLDHQFMELTAQIPTHLKWNRGQGKIILKKALESRLPHDIMYRKKQGFGVPIGKWFRTSLFDYARETLLEKDDLFDHLFSREGLEDLFKDPARIEMQGRQIWALLTLKLWYARFFKNAPNPGRS